MRFYAHTMRRLLGFLLTLSILLGLTLPAMAATVQAAEDSYATTTPQPNVEEDFEVDGGVITGYNGSSKTVVIPDAIDGTPITGIGENAFFMTGVQVIVIPSTVTEVEDNVFINTPGPDDDFLVANTITDLYFYGPCPDNLANAFASSYDDFTLNVHCKNDYEADYTSAVWDWYDYNYVDATVIADVTVTEDPSYGETTGPDEPDPPVDPVTPDDSDADPNSPCVVVPAANAEEDFMCMTDGEIYAYMGSSPDVVIPGMLDGVAVTKIDSKYGFSKQEVRTIVIPSTVTSVAAKAFTAASYGGAPFALTDLYFYGSCPNGLASALTASDVTTDLTVHCRAQYKADYAKAVAGWGDTVTVLGHVMVTQDPELPKAPDPTVETPEPTDAGEFDFDPAFGLLTKFTGSSAQVTVPATIGRIRVTYFDAQAFSNASDVKKLVIPSTVERLGTGSLRDGMELYFYGDCPENLEEAVSDLYDSVQYTIHCKPEYVDDFYVVADTVNGSVDIYPDIDSDLEDPSYGEDPAEYQKPTGGSEADAFSYALVENADGETTAQIIGYVGVGGDITLPATATVAGKEYPVTAVAESAFNSYNGTQYQDGKVIRDPVALSHISKITVPPTIKTIGAQAFSYVGRYSSAAPEGMLTKLTQIVFEGAEVELGNGALSRNAALTGVTLPENMTTIPDSLFLSDTALESVELPEGIVSIGMMAFSGCTGLARVKFQGVVPPEMAIYESSPASIAYPFVGCTGTVLYVPKENLDAYLEAWDEMLSAPAAQAGFLLLAGYDENGSTAARIPNFTVYEEGHEEDSAEPRYLEYHVTGTDIEKKTGTVELAYVGYDGRGLTLDVPQTVTTQVMGEDWTFTVTGIGEYAMQSYVTTGSQGLYWFDEVHFPDTLEYIGEGGCWNLAAITDLDLTNTKVHTLGTYAFKACKELRTIELPATLKTMGEGKDSVIVGDGDNREEIATVENVFAFCDSLERITVDPENPYYKDEDGVLLSKDGKRLIRYPNARNAVHYDIPEGVEVLAQQSFMQSYTGVYDKKSKLETVTFPSTLKKIENLAFRQSNLKSVTLPPNCEFGECIFDINSNLSEVVIPEGVTEIGYYMFWECEKLTQVTFPNSLKKIGDSAFACTGLMELDLNQVEVIEDYAFMRCQGLTELEIAGTANTLGKGVFTSCNNLQKVTFADGCKTVGAYMFTNDMLLEDLTLADSIETIGAGAFTDCWALETVVMPKSLQRMGTGVFFDCYEKLKNVIFPDEAPLSTLPEGTFESCQGLEYLYLGKNITATGPVSLYDTPVGMLVECGCKEKDFTRNAFDVYGYDLDNNELFARYQVDDEMGEDAYGNPVYLVWLTELGESSGCSGNKGTPTEDGLYLAYIAADGAPEFTFGTQTPNEPAVLWVYEQYQDGQNVLRKSYKASELEQLESQGLVGYQFWRMGDNAPITVAATAYVTMDDLLADANASFAAGDTIHVADAADNYTADLPYAISLSDKYFITDTGAMEVPVALATCWNSGEGHTQQALEEIAGTAYNSSNLRFCYGISQEKYDKQTAHGSRLASNVAQITIRHPYDMPVDTSGLDAAIAKAEALDEDDYTAGSYSKVADALAAAKTVAANETATQEDVDVAADALNDAIAALVPASGDDKPTIDGFTDLAADWYMDGVRYMVENGLMKGADATTFKPLANIKRGDLVVILYRIENEPDVSKLSNPFKDIQKDYYLKAITWAADKGIVTGKTDTTFAPEDPITREQLATILYRWSKQTVPTDDKLVQFPDGGKVQGFAKDAVNWAVDQGIVTGVASNGSTTLNPQGNANRAQIAVMLQRYLNK